jgi:hypothetical protein
MGSDFLTHRQWFDAYIYRAQQERGNWPLAPGPYSGAGRSTCPCCGYPTLEMRGQYDVCELCDWEDDDQDDPRADEVWGGPNHEYSLAEARLNFQRYLHMYDPDKPDWRPGGETAIEHNIKQSIVAAFDAMLNERDQARLVELWQQVVDNERQLQQAVEARIRGLGLL